MQESERPGLPHVPHVRTHTHTQHTHSLHYTYTHTQVLLTQKPTVSSIQNVTVGRVSANTSTTNVVIVDADGASVVNSCSGVRIATVVSSVVVSGGISGSRLLSDHGRALCSECIVYKQNSVWGINYSTVWSVAILFVCYQ